MQISEIMLDGCLKSCYNTYIEIERAIMKNPETMTDQQLTSWLNKTYQSISNRPVSCSHASMRGETLLDRYEELRYEATQRTSDVWFEFCQSNGSCPTHDGYDLFA